ncbi:MAG: hypothetical protein KIS66_05220 [Fimbriimonadaceae bacterium]|nr:hypothetical protein [Fimbriimonadaceae bacterium]
MASPTAVRTLGILALSQAFAFIGAQAILRGLVVYEASRHVGPPAGWLVPLNAVACLALGVSAELGRRGDKPWIAPAFAMAGLSVALWGRFGGLPSPVYASALTVAGLACLVWFWQVRRTRGALLWAVPFAAWLVASDAWVR